MPGEFNPRRWIIINGGYNIWSFDKDTSVMTCHLCNFSSSRKKMFPIVRHAERRCHKKNLEIFVKHRVNNFSTASDFKSDITKLLVSCNIPLFVVEHPNFVDFMEKYTGKSVPTHFSLMQSLEVESQVVISKIKQDIGEKDIFMLMEETKDVKDQSMISVMIGPLDEHFLGRPYLINFTDVINTDSLTIKEVVVTSLRNTLGSNFKDSRLKAFITDGATYCAEAAAKLKYIFPAMIHVTCNDHGLDKIAELSPFQFPSSDVLISEIKKVFLHPSARKQNFVAYYSSMKTIMNKKHFKDHLIIKSNSEIAKIEQVDV